MLTRSPRSPSSPVLLVGKAAADNVRPSLAVVYTVLSLFSYLGLLMVQGGNTVLFMTLSLLFLAQNLFHDKHSSAHCTTKCELLFCSNFREHYTQRQAFKKAIKMQTDLAAQE